jgi:hypothetical protein
MECVLVAIKRVSIFKKMDVLLIGPKFAGKRTLKRTFETHSEYKWNIRLAAEKREVIAQCVDKINILCIDATSYADLAWVIEIFYILRGLRIKTVLVAITKMDLLMWDLNLYKKIKAHVQSALYAYEGMNYIITPTSISRKAVNVLKADLVKFNLYDLLSAAIYASVFISPHEVKRASWGLIEVILPAGSKFEADQHFTCYFNNTCATFNVLSFTNNVIDADFDIVIDYWAGMPILIECGREYACGIFHAA